MDCFEICNEGIIFILAQGQQAAGNLYIANGIEAQRTKFNEKIAETKVIVKPDTLNFINDGAVIEGFVLKPVNYDEKKLIREFYTYMEVLKRSMVKFSVMKCNIGQVKDILYFSVIPGAKDAEAMNLAGYKVTHNH